MKRNKTTFIALALLASAAMAAGAGYVPEKWNLEAREKFAARRFGIFIHWGLYANYAQGEWYQQQIGIDTETYGRMKDGFCPSRFDAKVLLQLPVSLPMLHLPLDQVLFLMAMRLGPSF